MITIPLLDFMLILLFLVGPRLMLYLPGNSSLSHLIRLGSIWFFILRVFDAILSDEFDGFRLGFLDFYDNYQDFDFYW